MSFPSVPSKNKIKNYLKRREKNPTAWDYYAAYWWVLEIGPHSLVVNTNHWTSYDDILPKSLLYLC